MNVTELDKRIKELERCDDITPDMYDTLANLYIIRDHYTQDDVEAEMADILPAYRKYIDIKTKYQMAEITDAPVVKCMNSVCREIYELITTLYRCSDLPKERQLISDMINRLVNIC